MPAPRCRGLAKSFFDERDISLAILMLDRFDKRKSRAKCNHDAIIVNKHIMCFVHSAVEVSRGADFWNSGDYMRLPDLVGKKTSKRISLTVKRNIEHQVPMLSAWWLFFKQASEQ